MRLLSSRLWLQLAGGPLAVVVLTGGQLCVQAHGPRAGESAPHIRSVSSCHAQLCQGTVARQALKCVPPTVELPTYSNSRFLWAGVLPVWVGLTTSFTVLNSQQFAAKKGAGRRRVACNVVCSVLMADELEAELALEAEIEAEARDPEACKLAFVEAAEEEELTAAAAWMADKEFDQACGQAVMLVIEELVAIEVDSWIAGVARQVYVEHTYVRSVPPLQLLASHVVAENQERESTELSSRLKREKDADLTRLRCAADAQIAAIRAKLARDMSAAEHAHALQAQQERSRIVAEQTASLEHMKPSLDAVACGWVTCASNDCKQLFRPEERTNPDEGCSSTTCTMHKRYCDGCCQSPVWPDSMHIYIRGHCEDDDEPYRDLVMCNWCEEFLCPECCRGHEAACAAAHEGRCGYEARQEYIAADRVGDEVRVGKAKGHCGRPATEDETGCRNGENGDDSCGIVVCDSCAWVCQGYHWSGRDRHEERECRTRLCQLHAPPPGQGCKKPRYGYYGRSMDAEAAPEGMCGLCDGELPDRRWQHDMRVAFAQSALERAQNAYNYEMWM